MLFSRSALLSILALAIGANAHTYVWSVWVNGVDQGTGNGIRMPGYNGPPGIGYANSPVRDLNSIDLRCNVLGDIPNPTTIPVAPGDIVTLEWHHNNRTAQDDIIATSHKGASNIYLSPYPPTNTSWVKIQEEGETAPGVWYVAGKLNDRAGKQDVRIPEGLAPGNYLLRSELLALHEADVAHDVNMNRGTQIYISCVQLQITGSGTVTLPDGVGFPGAYHDSDPGIVFNIYTTVPASTLYPIPGPTVWAGAAASPDSPSYGTTLGYTVAQPWSTWIGDGFSTATLQTSLTIDLGTATTTKTYVPNWPTAPATTTSMSSSTPTPTGGSVNKYGQCGGIGYTGATACVTGTTCSKLNDYYYQCL
ncbi:carbohydrate-binding module family 1 protein [Hydnomerulius pinastri MD-312]|uniref:AA9 family lytic polysaccharide monooxygenase n=1 Tax=Hydnomerulius pinastri MD-312 TaxID=994086 RepID=A0A0C9W0F8_9AGAM|nr:carbohydrate-binding module family 1 protein [Hydnomerulius pinastri MD-312]